MGDGLELPNFPGALPDGVFVRNIPGGSFEQVTFRLDTLHALQQSGVLVYNDARSIERTVDKAMTSFRLARAGVATPATWVCESDQEAREIMRREMASGYKVVLKPLFGSRGKGLCLLETPEDLPLPSDCNGVYYLQRYIPTLASSGRDWRVMVVGGRAVGAMERRSTGWVTNRAQGGECLPADASGEIGRLAERATGAVGARYAGVDIIRHRNGHCAVLEVNGIPAWKGLQHVCSVDIADELAGDLLRCLPNAQLEAVS
jgi:RimK family alpha-L-glutamate ligase